MVGVNWRKSVVLKKLRRYGLGVVRPVVVRGSDIREFQRIPPVIANSIPKSGTHLLVQVLQALPCERDWGGFLASVPSRPFRLTRSNVLVRRIRALAPGELVGAHLYYRQEYVEAMRRVNAAHFFIVRDPRDVVVSEAYYLTYQNRWHGLHSRFRRCSSMRERFDLAIDGVDSMEAYPSLDVRLEHFEGWLKSENTRTIRYEDLLGENVRGVVSDIANFYRDQTSMTLDVDAVVDTAIQNIDPSRSHTFRSGKSGGWREELTSEQQNRINHKVERFTTLLGYPLN